MWARTLCPLSSSTLKKAFGSDSTTVPSISMAPSFLAMPSALRYLVWPACCCLQARRLWLPDLRPRAQARLPGTGHPTPLGADGVASPAQVQSTRTEARTARLTEVALRNSELRTLTTAQEP